MEKEASRAEKSGVEAGRGPGLELCMFLRFILSICVPRSMYVYTVCA